MDELYQLLGSIKKAFQRPLVQLAILLSLTSLLYLSTIPNQLVLDDETFFNWSLTHDLKNLPLFFTGVMPYEHLGDYRPMKGILLSLNYRMFGENLVGYHVQAIAIHLMSVVLVYMIVLRVLPDVFPKLRFKSFAKESPKSMQSSALTKGSSAWDTSHLSPVSYFPFLTCLIFALHPVNVEAIAFLTSSGDILGINFYLGAFYSFMRYLRELGLHNKSSRVWILLTILLFLLGLLTYEMVLTFPFMALLYLICFESTKKLREKIRLVAPLFITLLAYLTYRFAFLRLFYEEGYFLHSFIRTSLVMSVVGVKYLSLLVFPWTLNVNHQILPGIYAYVTADVNTSALVPPALSDPRILLAWLILCGLLGIALKSLRRRGEITFGLFWIALSLAPVANILPIPTLMSERYLYLASVGYAFLLSLVVVRLPRLFRSLKETRNYVFLFTLIGVGLLSGFYFVRSYIRIGDWRNSETLWQATYREVPESMMANHNLGMAYFAKGDLPRAITHLEFAASHNYGKIPKVHLNLGKAYLAKKRFSDALDQFKETVALDPHLSPGYFYIGNAYLELGDLNQAEEYFYKTLEVKSDFFDGHRQLAYVYMKQHKLDQAVLQYEELLKLNPLIIPAYYDLAGIYIKKGDREKARETLQRGLSKDPTSSMLSETLELFL